MLKFWRVGGTFDDPTIYRGLDDIAIQYRKGRSISPSLVEMSQKHKTD